MHSVVDPDQLDPYRSARAPADGQPEAGSTERLARAARAAEQLCAALWDALHEELRRSPPDARGTPVAELAVRLAQVCASVAELARRCTPLVPATTGARAAIGEAPESPPFPKPPALPESSPSPEPPASSEEISIRDARGEGPSAWVRAVGDRLQHYQRDTQPFAALLVEVTEAARLSDGEPAGDIAQLLARVQPALCQELRPVDDVTLESPGRWWLTLAQTDAQAARAVGERLVEAICSLGGELGLAPTIAIGIASCPEDGRDAASLAAHADVGLYAARVAGRTLPPA
ncbi:MAG TPA: diguanylate cyclase [Solirubrobacteraceae bacterium]|jgi:GGDEF domain-containing protein